LVSAVEAIAERAREGLCFILGNVEDGARLLGNISGVPSGIGTIAGALGTQLCNKPPDVVDPPPPPFTGGQCPGVRYDVNFTGTVPGNSPQTATVRLTGPLQYNAALAPVPPVTGCDDGEVWQRFSVSGSTETPVIRWQGCDATFTVNSVTPVSGGANNCGDPPPVYPPPGDVFYEGDDVTYEGDDNINITVPTAFIFAPVYVAIDGTLRVPVKIDFGGVDFSGEVTIAPEFNFEIAPTFNPPGPGVPDDPDGIGEPGEPSDPIPEVEELESTIVGVLVFSDIDPDGQPSGIQFQDGPNLFVPRAASVQFAIKTGNSIGWTSDQDVKSLECYVPCPAPQGAVAVRVSPMPGVQSRFTAVRGKPLTSF